MALCAEETVSLGVCHMDALLLGEEYDEARRLADDLISRYPDEPRLLKAAAYAALLDEESVDGSLMTVEFFERARQCRPHDLEACFWAGWTARACGESDEQVEHGAAVLSELSSRDIESRYVAYACASHPSQEGDPAEYERWVDKGLEILPNLAGLWESKIAFASPLDRQQELFDHFKNLRPFHDYCEMRAMEEYVASVIAGDYWFERWATLQDLLLRRPRRTDGG